MSAEIHPTAVIEDGAVIGEGNQIGPFCHIGPNVKLGNDNILQSHVVIDGNTQVGNGNLFFSFACIGKDSQDLKFKEGMTAYTKIGNKNNFREYVTVNAASIDGETTSIGNGCNFLSYSHVAHDCVVEDNVIISSNSMLAGHVLVERHAIINGKSGVVQFCRVGKFAYIGGYNKVTKDILPFCIADGMPSEPRAINKIGMERNGFDGDTISKVRQAYKIIMRSGKTIEEAMQTLSEEYPDCVEVQDMLTFCRESKAGLARPRARG